MATALSGSSPPPLPASVNVTKYFGGSSRKWSKETVLADHKDLQASAMGLSHHDNGQFALLGGRRYLSLINLSDPKSVCLKTTRNVAKWDVTSVQWAPMLSNRIAIAANDRIEVVNPETDLSHQQILKSHIRYISDIDWNPKEPEVLASGSHDASLNIWDLRTCNNSENRERPALTFNMIVAASQVKWNKIKSSVIATSHDGDLKLWDIRKASTPFMYISAHIGRIFSLDWSSNCPDSLVTSSQDCFVKFFNVASQSSKASYTLKTAVPVWKAKYTPFGDGLGTVIVPHLHRNDHSLFLWNYKHLDFPVHSFFGHKDVILDFDWKKSISADLQQDLQMVTWSRDSTLRIWTVELTTQYQCGVDALEDTSGTSDEDVIEETENLVETSPHPEDLSEEICPSSPRDSTPSKTLTRNTLQQEFELLTLNLGSVKAEGLSGSGKRSIKFTATVAANQAIHRVCLVVHFPVDYPDENSPPTFVFAKGTTLDPQARSYILKALRQTAAEKVKQKSPCLNPCLRQLETLLAELPHNSTELERTLKNPGESSKPSPPPYPLAGAALPSSNTLLAIGPVHMASYDNANIPYPRSTGAHFSPNGKNLVCFGKITHQKTLKDSEKSCGTPRSLASFEVESEPIPNISKESVSRKQSTAIITHNPYASIGYGSGDSNSNSLTRKGRFNITTSYTTETGTTTTTTGNTNSLTKKGRFRVKRVRTGSIDEGGGLRHDSKEQSPSISIVATSFPTTAKSMASPRVTIYNVSKLFPLDSNLAKKYKLWHNNTRESCIENSRLAAKAHRADLTKIWLLCSKIAKMKMEEQDQIQNHHVNQQSSSNELTVPWSVHPFGKPLLQSILNHCLKIGDFQTAASILCCFWSIQKTKGKENLNSSVQSTPSHEKNKLNTIEEDKINTKFWFMKPGAMNSFAQVASPYHTIQVTPTQKVPIMKKNSKKKSSASSTKDNNSKAAIPYTTSDNNLELYGAMFKNQRSNSWCEASEEALQHPGGAGHFSPLNTVAGTRPDVIPVIHIKDVWSSNQSSENVNLDQESPNTPKTETDSLIDPSMSDTYERLKNFYANQLYIWGHWRQRLCVLKTSTISSEKSDTNLNFAVDCLNDIKDNSDVVTAEETQDEKDCWISKSKLCQTEGNVTEQCRGCLKPSLVCVVCLLPIKGMASCCAGCAHPGHFKHLEEWFLSNYKCPVPGCDCYCTEY